MSLGDNKLEGTLPAELGKLESLKFLYVFSTQVHIYILIWMWIDR